MKIISEQYSENKKQGFTLAGVLVAVALFLILAGVAATHWSFIRQREKEEELIWRGNQYVRALKEYFKQFKTYPNKLEELLDEHCIRKLYNDPMTEDGVWELVRGNKPRPGQPVAGTTQSERPGAEKRESNAPQESSFVKTSGIIGVHSRSTEKAIKEYNEKRFYHQWVFTVADEQSKQGQKGGPQPGPRPQKIKK